MFPVLKNICVPSTSLLLAAIVTWAVSHLYDEFMAEGWRVSGWIDSANRSQALDAHLPFNTCKYRLIIGFLIQSLIIDCHISIIDFQNLNIDFRNSIIDLQNLNINLKFILYRLHSLSLSLI